MFFCNFLQTSFAKEVYINASTVELDKVTKVVYAKGNVEIYDNLKKTSKVSTPDGTPKDARTEVPDPRKGDTVGKVKATVEGTKLRQLLNELHSDEEQ